MEEVRICSADSHVNEPPAAWDRIPKGLRERGPHFVQDPPGKKGLYMVFDGHEPDPVGATFTAGKGKGPGVIAKTIETFTWEQWRGPWDSAARLVDMDTDGVGVEVLYPSMGRNLYTLRGEEVPLQQAGIRSYNDWLNEYCRVDSKRLVGLCLLSPLDVDWSVREMERSARLGHKGALLPSGLPEPMSYGDPGFAPIWQAAESMQFPLHFHVNIVQGADRTVARATALSLLQQGRRAMRRAIMEPLNLLTDLIYGRVLDDHPRLRLVFAEYDLSWVLPFLAKMDSGVRRARAENANAPTLKTLPSEAVRRQVSITFQEDRAGLAGALAAGLLDNCMWASDYPHGGSTWPHSRDIIRSQTEGLAAAAARKLLWDNAALLYGLG
jgi:predicted TIM-barrel fold metal-dependent hydrolase